jgi:hypothetical protein
MTQSDQKKARQAQAKAAKLLEAQELLKKRTEQFEILKQVLPKLKEQTEALQKNITRHQALQSHLTGVYREIDKLAKGRSQFEATDLAVQQANDIVRDAKELIQGDIYLDRVKELVPAGNNPFYPDILLTLTAVQQTLERYGSNISDLQKRLSHRLREARTIETALEYYVGGREWPTKENVKGRLFDGSLVQDWFRQYQYNEAEYFDFEKLDRLGLEEYFLKR